MPRCRDRAPIARERRSTRLSARSGGRRTACSSRITRARTRRQAPGRASCELFEDGFRFVSTALTRVLRVRFGAVKVESNSRQASASARPGLVEGSSPSASGRDLGVLDRRRAHRARGSQGRRFRVHPGHRELALRPRSDDRQQGRHLPSFDAAPAANGYASRAHAHRVSGRARALRTALVLLSAGRVCRSTRCSATRGFTC